MFHDNFLDDSASDADDVDNYDMNKIKKKKKDLLILQFNVPSVILFSPYNLFGIK